MLLLVESQFSNLVKFAENFSFYGRGKDWDFDGNTSDKDKFFCSKGV